MALKLEPSKKILYLIEAVRTLQEDLCGKKGKKLVVVFKRQDKLRWNSLHPMNLYLKRVGKNCKYLI